ncbi:hypothetical protein E0E50_15195 [Azotobacter chroococcum subsp. isscasi]|uniref:hypothetical protein n=1 Tax=Azotobacter chroococcum TaxID=353 RepID=UPI00103A0B6A|nr:hypothetical protein [Azotobacter chroococcum]TBW08303.1 hypothetical protein E0E50_15195 [Azotobacter chroococcum subsp. isscasi]
MGTLLDLVATLTAATKTTAAPLVEVTSAPAANDALAAPEPLQATAATPAAPTPAPAAERPAEARRNAWTITRGGKPVCTICGAPMTYVEALAEARWHWPDADIE